MPKAPSSTSSEDVKPYALKGSQSSSPGSKPKTANRLTIEQRHKLMEMAMDTFLKHANYKDMAEATGLELSAIRSQFSAKVNWKNLRKAAIENA